MTQATAEAKAPKHTAKGSRKPKTSGKKTASAKPATTEGKAKGPKVQYSPGDVTRAGCTVVKQTCDPDYGVHQHRLTVRCVVTNREFTIATQDAFQVRFHPDVARKERRAWLADNAS
ncbi:hypothetical protein LCGC14_0414080 [marine sediment metagenome]|uniref:Uncharacterized protein n=1 Tax=marine sediment metagenome TaxID=412755 RepID=A0A0F9TAX5_9ZZZZ